MFCKKCGSPLEPTDAFCKNCGEPVNAPNPVAGSAPLTQPTAQVETPVVPTPAPTEPVTPSAVNPVLGGEAVTPVPTAPVQVPVTPTPEPAPMTTPAPTEPATPTVAGTAPTETPKKNKTFLIVAIVLGVAILVVGGILISKNLGSKDVETTTTPTEDTAVNPVNDNNGVNNSGAYNYKDYQLPLPNGYTAEEDSDNGLILTNIKKVIRAKVVLIPGYTIDDVKNEAEGLKNELAAQMTILSVNEKTYEGIEWLVFNAQATQNGQTYKVIYAFAGAGQFTVSGNIIINQGTSTQDNILTDFSKMYNGMTYMGTKSFSADDKEGSLKEIISKKVDLTGMEIK